MSATAPNERRNGSEPITVRSAVPLSARLADPGSKVVDEPPHAMREYQPVAELTRSGRQN